MKWPIIVESSITTRCIFFTVTILSRIKSTGTITLDIILTIIEYIDGEGLIHNKRGFHYIVDVRS